jgi:hypothetical protein
MTSYYTEQETREKLLTYNDLAKLIAEMSPEDKAKPVLSQNNSTGAFFGFEKIDRTEDESDEFMPINHPILDGADGWFFYHKGKPTLSVRYEPDWEELR